MPRKKRNLVKLVPLTSKDICKGDWQADARKTGYPRNCLLRWARIEFPNDRTILDKLNARAAERGFASMVQLNDTLPEADTAAFWNETMTELGYLK